MAQRGHVYAIIDEIDSILIDEARTPLIISGPTEDRSELYRTLDKIIPRSTRTGMMWMKARTATFVKRAPSSWNKSFERRPAGRRKPL